MAYLHRAFVVHTHTQHVDGRTKKRTRKSIPYEIIIVFNERQQ